MISIIICSIDDTKFRAVCENYSRLLGNEPFEIIGIHDARSLAEGYNRGIEKSSGDIVIFSHDDIEILSHDFNEKLKKHLNTYDIIGVAGTTHLTGALWVRAGIPHLHGIVAHFIKRDNCYSIQIYGAYKKHVLNIQALDGLFFAVRRKVLETICFDEIMFDGFHLYDVDFTFSSYLAGFSIAVCNDISIIHMSSGAFDDKWKTYAQLFRNKYASILPAFSPHPSRWSMVQVSKKEEILEVCSEIVAGLV